MPYKTRPYISNSAGQVPDLRKEFIISANELVAKDAFSRNGNFTIALPPASIQRVQTWLQKPMGIGTVIVKDQAGNSYDCNNLPNVSDFIDALYGRHPDVKKDIEELERPAKEAAELAALQLRPFIVSVPALPKDIFNLVSGFSNGKRPFLDWHVSEGQIVKAGTVIATYNAKPLKENPFKKTSAFSQIKMPLDGSILSLNGYDYPDWSSYDIDIQGNHLPSNSFLFSFQYAASDENYRQLLAEQSQYSEDIIMGYKLQRASANGDLLDYAEWAVEKKYGTHYFNGDQKNPNHPCFNLRKFKNAHNKVERINTSGSRTTIDPNQLLYGS